MINLLIPVTVRPNLNRKFFDRAWLQASRIQSRMHARGDRANIHVWDKEYLRENGENFFARLARMRNDVLDRCLDNHTHILWVDADIQAPWSLAEKLLSITEEHIISPMVFIEGTKLNYDTAGFRTKYNERSRMQAPYFDPLAYWHDGAVELSSVGGVVLVPAKLHLEHGVMFSAPQESEKENDYVTEWWSVCEGARRFGIRTLCATRVKTYHADLPKHGEEWH